MSDLELMGKKARAASRILGTMGMAEKERGLRLGAKALVD